MPILYTVSQYKPRCRRQANRPSLQYTLHGPAPSTRPATSLAGLHDRLALAGLPWVDAATCGPLLPQTFQGLSGQPCLRKLRPRVNGPAATIFGAAYYTYARGNGYRGDH